MRIFLERLDTVESAFVSILITAPNRQIPSVRVMQSCWDKAVSCSLSILPVVPASLKDEAIQIYQQCSQLAKLQQNVFRFG